MELMVSGHGTVRRIPPAGRHILGTVSHCAGLLFRRIPMQTRPAGGSFTVEIAENQAFTSISYNGSKASPWGDGQQHPQDYVNLLHIDPILYYLTFIFRV